MSREVLEKKIKVLHVVGAMNAAGLETLIMNIYRNIDRSKIQFDFVVQTTEKCFYDDEIIEMGGRIISHPKPKKGLRRYKDALEKTIKEYGPYDAIHSHVLFFSGVVLPVAKKQNIPIRIAHSHNTSDSKTDSILRKIYRQFMRKEILKNSTHLIGCSKEAGEYVFGNSPVKLGAAKHFPNAIDLTKYKNLSKDKSYLIKELEISTDATIIGHIGRFTRQKNHVFIIEIFSAFLKEDPNAHLVLVGDGDERDNIVKLVHEKRLGNNVHFLGLRKDIEYILSSIDVFLFPSLYEGLGIVLVEAQAAGVPCVISKQIPVEADLDIGLVKSLNLSDGTQSWISAIKESMIIDTPKWDNLELALIDCGYDINASSQRLLNIYCGDE
ncbi:glycosyltransferase family 1 protein [Bacillus carboniphilus]|uniref:Glycosyltransferase family 1 protein n=1 Tax=Bacillus carboniphilus TaxID=86663 RepID=A0ABY9JQ90_9BACI|nr:glycosyltransferase family 1 protein [Bacillus carboniphilus]WLR41569.1 glycosyltransferase family 1 protein [Bacillus carboniphilus]